MAQKIKAFFEGAEEVWDSIPGYLKVFLYSTVSSVAGLYFTRTLTFDAVLAIVLFNLGIYTVPRAVNEGVKRME